MSQGGRNSRDAGRPRQHSTTPLRESSTPGRQYTRAGSLREMLPSQPPSGQDTNFIEKLARFNMPGIMLAGVMIPTGDVELDSEAHLPNRDTTRKAVKRRKRLKTICATLWCKLIKNTFIVKYIYMYIYIHNISCNFYTGTVIVVSIAFKV